MHYSSGPANHFFYLLSEGSGAKTHQRRRLQQPDLQRLDGRPASAAPQAAAIWYRALTVYMTSSTNYAGARVATVNAATDLYGATSTQVAAVKAAWAAVVGQVDPRSTRRHGRSPHAGPAVGVRPPVPPAGAPAAGVKLPTRRIVVTASRH